MVNPPQSTPLTTGNSDTLLKPNTPAGEYWILYVAYTQTADTQETRIPIAFLPTGEVDTTHTVPADLTRANDLLAPAAQLLQSLFDDNSFDIWKFFNWLFIGFYWTLLADLGQIAPTGYDTSTFISLNYPQPVPFPSTNNIFVNGTLYAIYSAYLNNTLGPVLQENFGTLSLPPVPPFDDNTRLTPVNTTILQSYSCSQRRLRDGMSLVILVVVADYALITGAYKFIVLVAGWFQKRKDGSKSTRCKADTQ